MEASFATRHITAWLNGVKVQDNVSLPNKTGAGKEEAPTLLPIRIQDHQDPVRFRNVWIVDRGLASGEFPVNPTPEQIIEDAAAEKAKLKAAAEAEEAVLKAAEAAAEKAKAEAEASEKPAENETENPTAEVEAARNRNRRSRNRRVATTTAA